MKTALPKLLLALPLVTTCAALAAQDTTTAADYGRTREQAIEVCKPDGQRAHLARLVCPDQSHPKFERRGSVGPRNDLPKDLPQEQMMQRLLGDRFAPLADGATDHHMIDAYAVQCGKTTHTLYLDLYHCHTPAPDTAPEGFTILR